MFDHRAQIAEIFGSLLGRHVKHFIELLEHARLARGTSVAVGMAVWLGRWSLLLLITPLALLLRQIRSSLRSAVLRARVSFWGVDLHTLFGASTSLLINGSHVNLAWLSLNLHFSTLTLSKRTLASKEVLWQFC